MASNPYLTVTPGNIGYNPNYTVNIPTPGGNFQLNLGTGDFTLTGDAGGINGTLAGNIGNAYNGMIDSGTLSIGGASITINKNGNDSVSISNGILTGTLNFTNPSLDGATITGVSLTAKTPEVAGATGAEASVSLTSNAGLWTGVASATLTSPTGEKIEFSEQFNPANVQPCSVLPAAVQPTCALLQSSAQSGIGTINTNEQQQLNEIGITGDLVSPSTQSGALTLANDDSAGIGYDSGSGYFEGGSGTSGTGTGTGTGTGFSPFAVHRGGYAAALATHSGKSVGSSIAEISASAHNGSPAVRTAGITIITSTALANAISRETAGTNQSFWAVGTQDGENLFGSGGTVIGINADLAGGIYNTTASGTGATLAHFNSSGVITSEDITGTGESVTINNLTIDLASSSSATVTGSNNNINMGSSSSAVMNGNDNGVYASGDQVTLTGTGGDAVVGNLDNITLNGSGQQIEVLGNNNTVYASNPTIDFYVKFQRLILGEHVVGSGDIVNYYVQNPGTNGRPTWTLVTPPGSVTAPSSWVPTSVAAHSLVQAMALYAPESAAESNVVLHPDIFNRHSLAASAYAHTTV
jgi:hypothetical protein